MAKDNQKTQAEKAAASKKKASAKKTSTAKKSSGTGKKSAPKTVEEPLLSARAVLAGVCLCLFILFLIICLQPDGKLLQLLRAFFFGVFGKVGFYIWVPALLYLFIILAFSGKRPVIMRSVCLVAFVLSCGCIAHLALDPSNLGSGFALVADLFTGGNKGTTGGMLCGLIAMGLRYVFGTVLSYIILALAAVFTILATFQITIPSIIRAVKNRPRAEWELEKEEEAEPAMEPAALVVNHIATKRIEHEERRRSQQAAAAANIDIPLDDEAPASKEQKKKPSAKVSDMMRQIDAEVDAPVTAAAKPVEADDDDAIITSVPQDDDPVIPPVFKPVPEEPRIHEEPVPQPIEPAVPAAPGVSGMPPLELPIKSQSAPVAEPAVEKVTAKEARTSAAEVADEIQKREEEQAQVKPVYCFPPIDLLKRPARGAADGTDEMRENSRRLNETLASFNVAAHIVNVTRGPSVTRYEVELEKGVKLSKLTNCADDIALSLGASGVRIAAVPGKISVVGIEVPNRAVTTVTLREVIDSQEFTQAKSKSSFAVGKDIGGSCIVGNIRKLPHMLIAGTTGSGKSVCMNSIIISLLYKASPDDVKLIMVDPKMVELGIYNGIPHLLIPVVTDPKKAAGSLQWAVTEMMRRYKTMSDAGVRDLESYNSIIEGQEIDGQKLPQVVVIIDELADLMLVAAKEVEESICRIAQMGRAAGIHLIIATQRPSADVITGLMKANIPSRIAFAVASAMESRIILDTQGAEKLVGKGDMLYAPIGCGKPKRVQGCFVSDSEVEAVASYVKDNFTAQYDQSVMKDIEQKASQTGKQAAAAAEPEANADELAGDEMLPAAVDVILETGQASVSMLQRRLKLGYARAARIVDEMEERGIVGPFKGSKPREILVTKEQWESMKSGQPQQLEFEDLPADFDEGVPEEID